MNIDIAIVFAITALAVLLFITERVRVDLVALLVMASLALAGILTPVEALSGFSSAAVVTVWAVLILSAGLARTGVAGSIGHRVLGLAGDSETRLVLLIMLMVSGLIRSRIGRAMVATRDNELAAEVISAGLALWRRRGDRPPQ